MFSKLIAFGLCALTLAAAAPSQQLVISCAIEESSPATLGSAAHFEIVPGVYRIVNQPAQGALTAGLVNQPVIFSKIREFPGPQQEWKVVSIGNGKYQIWNNLLNLPIAYVPNDSNVPLTISTGGRFWAAEFAIDPTDGGDFVVEVPGKDQVWTLDDMTAPTSPIKLRGRDNSGSQHWSFIRLRDA
ncbi:hypothetical protein B0H19DRAFT_1265372 [Mycena capillaripes]|nr:hypothetical protein B0H19DRAFT_1265372 [Mycena capillaripes]